MEEKSVEEYLELVRAEPIEIYDIPKEIFIKSFEMCVEAAKHDYSGAIPQEALKKYPEIYLEIVKINGRKLGKVPKEALEKYPEIYLEAIKDYPDAEGMMSKEVLREHKEVLKKHPKIYLELVKNDYSLKNVPKEMLEEYPEICIAAVEHNPAELEYVPVKVQIENPEMCIKAVEEDPFSIINVCKEIQIGNPEMCIDAVKLCGDVLEYICKEVQIEYPEMCIDAVKRRGSNLEGVCKEVQIEYPEMCIDAVKRRGPNLEYVCKEVQIEYPEMCIDAVKQRGSNLEYVCKEVQIEYPEMCIDAVKQRGANLAYVCKEVQIEYPEMCIDAVKQRGSNLEYVCKEVQIEYPEMCIDAVKQNGANLEYVCKEVQIEHPGMCMDAVKQNIQNLTHVVEETKEEHPEICIEVLKKQIELYKDEKYISKGLRNNEKIREYMFEDIERLKGIKERAYFDIGSNDYNELTMDIFYSKMIKSIGFDEIEKLIKIPSLSKEEIEEYSLECNERINELFERTYSLEGKIKATKEIFNAIDLSGYEKKGKNLKFEVYKNINKILEEEGNLSFEEVVRKAIVGSDLEVKEELIEKINGRKDKVVVNLARENISKVEENLTERLNEGLQSQQEPVRKIIESKLLESIKNNEGKYDVDEVVRLIGEEIEKRNETGEQHYSEHIRSQKEKIEEVTRDFLNDANIDKKVSMSIVNILKEKKEEIGKGWIRKIEQIPSILNKEEYERQEEKLGIKLEGTYEARLKEGKSEVEAYRILKENGVKGVITYNQIELMFSKMKEPYSEEFKNYYAKNQKEIIERPEVYTELSKIHNNFDSIINRPEVKNRYESGALTIDNILGICAGQNNIARALGGTTYKIPNPEKHNKSFYEYAHSIKIDKNSKFYNILKTNKMKVNSVHKRTIDTCPKLDKVAFCEDSYLDVIEAKNKKFYIGVRFHPECLYKKDEKMNRIFEEFVNTCR